MNNLDLGSIPFRGSNGWKRNYPRVSNISASKPRASARAVPQSRNECRARELVHGAARSSAQYCSFGLSIVLAMVMTLVATPTLAVDKADTIIVGAKVWTGAPADAAKSGTEPTAIGLKGNKIIAVGADAEVRAVADEKAKVIDAGGRRVLPGITDSHTHIISGGFFLSRLDLRGANSRDEFVRAIETEAKKLKPGQWLQGGRWSVESWAKSESPHKSWIDPFTAEIPVCLPRMDGHQVFVNSAALKLAGIDANGPADPVGGEIERDPKTKEPTGILKDAAADFVEKLIPSPTDADMDQALIRAMKHANSLGITSVHDMAAADHLNVFARAHRKSALTLRIVAYINESDWAGHAWIFDGYPLNGDVLRVAGFKGFMDGSLGSRTAYMRAPYSDAPSHSPHPRGMLSAMADPLDKIRENIVTADALLAQLAIHAIGDEAIHQTLNAYENAQKKNNRKDPMHRIEHAQHILPVDLVRFKQLGVVASMQPFHKADDGRYAEAAIGKTRLAGSYAYRQLLDQGATLIFGSDWPVVTMNPFAGMDAAVNSKTLAGNVWLHESAISPMEALRAYTSTPQKVVGRDAILGTIEVGKLADLVIVDGDPIAGPNHEIGKVTAWKTLMDGKVVFEK